MHKKTLTVAFLLAFSTQASTPCEKAGALTGLVVSTLTLGYAVTATILGSIPEPGRYWGCDSEYSLIYCNSTASGYQCGNTVSDGDNPFCINQAKRKNPMWAQRMQISGIVLDAFAFVSTAFFALLAYSVFKNDCCTSSTTEPSKA